MRQLTVRKRLLQMETWLRAHFPTPYPVVVKWVPKIAAGRDEPAYIRRSGHVAECYWHKPNIVIRLSTPLNRIRQVAVDSLMHEWSHAVTMPNDRMHRLSSYRQEHPDEWALVYGRIYRNWVDNGGSDESRSY